MTAVAAVVLAALIGGAVGATVAVLLVRRDRGVVISDELGEVIRDVDVLVEKAVMAWATDTDRERVAPQLVAKLKLAHRLDVAKASTGRRRGARR